MSDKQVDVLSATTLKPQSSAELTDYVVKMAFSKDNKKLWILDANRNIQCFDLTPKKISPSAKFHQEEAYWIYPCSKRSALILASHDGKGDTTRISFYDLKSQKLIRRIDLEARLRFLNISPDGSQLVGCPTEGSIALWNIDALIKKRT